MDILNAIREAQGGNAVQQLGNRFGLQPDQVSSALSALVPALAAGFQNNMSSPQGIEGLVAALSGGQHQRYVDDAVALNSPDTIADGNGILSHVFGTKAVSREVASRAAVQTGLGEGVLKSMLPVVAAMMMGTMSKRVSQSAAVAPVGTSGAEGLFNMLTPVLDANRDGSPTDDIVGMVGRFLSGR